MLLRRLFFYLDATIDLILIAEYLKENNLLYGKLTGFFLFLPNILLILFSSLFQLKDKTKNENKILEVFLTTFLIAFKLDNLLGNTLSIYNSFKSNEKIEFANLNYILLISNCFQTAFNAYPLTLVQSTNLLSNFDKSTFLNQKKIQIFKIILSACRIIWYSSKLISHFLKNEFCLKKLNKNQFETIRIFTNTLLFVSKQIFILITFKTNLWLAGFIFVFKFLIDLSVLQSILFKNSLGIFWTFFLSAHKQFAHVEDLFYLNKKCFVFALVEIVVYFLFALKNTWNQLNLKLLIIFLFFIYLWSYLIEFLYWNYMKKKVLLNQIENDYFIDEEFSRSVKTSIVLIYLKKWILVQSNIEFKAKENPILSDQSDL